MCYEVLHKRKLTILNSSFEGVTYPGPRLTRVREDPPVARVADRVQQRPACRVAQYLEKRRALIESLWWPASPTSTQPGPYA
ncbi:MAG: hypothetical protein QOE51_1229 [Actinoplanes sp.]|nr:hypothetical protein [Actinoplanes sp.]